MLPFHLATTTLFDYTTYTLVIENMCVAKGKLTIEQ